MLGGGWENWMEKKTKIFTLREVPLNIHQRWKAAAAITDMTMQDFAVIAIEIQSKSVFDNRADGKADDEKK